MTDARTRLMNNLGLLILRLGVGGYMLTHGWGKLQRVLAGELDKFADPLGLGPELSLLSAVGAEFFGALLVMVGLATRLSAGALVFTMGVAAFIVHAADPWTMGDGASKEPALLYLIPFLALVLTGPGKLSLDTYVRRAWQRRKARA